mmetsp:Transcript_18472/g.24409  ORF Transcript_18472/g.24409 Transcript_18472/m.24409 type:complete len:323 (-) Transcript_18472:377-1345(-)|eukprot:CAMPEP_0117772560 /NCGR_PEP_ID=MMETSP0947-20121206/25199_1 /TAXON_ID=44440 /ORGANISM="Chattonella subsalsa, Strain CCMP2191" /LENGTH=322 /DNA_ID=CAMNT_0005598267 /DNA_START=53 /DNA_END=1021 /DNA_ORIENTATION=+
MNYNCGGTIVDVDDVVAIATEAGEAIMEIYKDDSEWDVKMKADDSPLTQADLAANKIICEKLTAKYPSIPIISEENKMEDYSKRKDYKYFFLVDPLDGTKEFIKRNGQFTVNIGLCEGNKPVLGVVRCPGLDIAETYSGVVGEGANVEDDADRYPASIRCKAFSEEDEGLKIVASLSHSNKETEDFIKKYKGATTTSMGSSLKLLLVAKGEAHIYPRIAPTSEWDTCAAHAIVLAAGGEVLQHEGGQPCDHMKPLVYNKENILNPYFVVYGKRKSNEPEPVATPAPATATVKKEAVANPNFGLILAILVVLAAVAGGYLAMN